MYPKHGYSNDSSNRQHRRKGFLGSLFSSWLEHPQLGAYTIEAVLGTGSYGVVLKAHKHGQAYAIKAFIGSDTPSGPSSDDLLACPNYENEANLLQSIAHPRIPRFIESFTQDNLHFLVQEYLDAIPLSTLYHQCKIFTETEVYEITRQLLEIMVYLHQETPIKKPIIHRDLRLSNLLLKNNALYLIDFGFACLYTSDAKVPLASPESPKIKRIPGSSTYRLLRKHASPQSDLFGIAVVAIDLLSSQIQDTSLFELLWQDVLPISQPFLNFLEELLKRKSCYVSAEEALQTLNQITPQ